MKGHYLVMTCRRRRSCSVRLDLYCKREKHLVAAPDRVSYWQGVRDFQHQIGHEKSKKRGSKEPIVQGCCCFFYCHFIKSTEGSQRCRPPSNSNGEINRYIFAFMCLVLRNVCGVARGWGNNNITLLADVMCNEVGNRANIKQHFPSKRRE